MEATVIECLPNEHYRVRLLNGDTKVFHVVDVKSLTTADENKRQAEAKAKATSECLLRGSLKFNSWLQIHCLLWRHGYKAHHQVEALTFSKQEAGDNTQVLPRCYKYILRHVRPLRQTHWLALTMCDRPALCVIHDTYTCMPTFDWPL